LKRNYHTITKIGQANGGRLTEFLSRNGQALLPMVDLIEQSRLAVDELIDVAGRATIEAVLELSAAQVAGPRTPVVGGKSGEVSCRLRFSNEVNKTRMCLEVNRYPLSSLLRCGGGSRRVNQLPLRSEV